MKCQMSICESWRTQTYPLQPFLLDAASLAFSPELSKVGRAKKQCSLHTPITKNRPHRALVPWRWHVSVTFTPPETLLGEGRQLTQGVRCSHVYLLSTLEDLVLPSLLLPQISFKNKPITNCGGYFTIPAPQNSHGASQAPPESLCLLLK